MKMNLSPIYILQLPQADGSKKFTPLPMFTMLFAVSVMFTAVVVILLCLVGILREMRRTTYGISRSIAKRSALGMC